MKPSPTEKWIKDLQAVLYSLEGMQIDERTRATIRRALAAEIVRAEDALIAEYSNRNLSEKWKQSDIDILEAALNGAPAVKTWGEELLILGMLVERLGRGEKVVKKKAIELGHGSKVDYWSNRENS